MGKLDDIRKPVSKELVEFEKHFKDSMKSNVPLLDKITYYIVQRKGKQIRPLFVFLCSKMINPEIKESSFVAASLIELMHTATLVHDDVVDESFERRGFFSINALWKNKIAVLVGDYLLSKGLLMSVDTNSFDMLKIVSIAVKEIIEGELLQMEKAIRLDIKEDVYFEIIRQKTASLIAAACSAGIAATTNNPELIEKGRIFGEKVGISFQIKDDLFDYGSDDVGKPLGIDIKEKKMTLPLIRALSQTDAKTKRKILKIIKKQAHKKSKRQEVIDFVKSTDGLEYTKNKMMQLKNEAFDLLKEFPQNEANDALKKLVLFVTERKK